MDNSWSARNTDVHNRHSVFLTPFYIGICPMTILAGGLTLIDSSFAAFYNIILTVFPRNPAEKGVATASRLRRMPNV